MPPSSFFCQKGRHFQGLPLCLLVLLPDRGTRCNTTFLSLSSSPVPAVPSPQIWSRMLWLRPGCSLPAGHARSHARSPCSGCGSCLPGCICWLQPYREPSTGPGLSSGTIDPWSLGKSPRALGSMGSNSLSLFCIGPVVGEFYIWLSAHRRDRLQCSCN